MPDLCAQPYDLAANGFYFDCAEQFNEKAGANRNRYGEPVEEYEIQFIDGDRIDYLLFAAFGVDQSNLASFFNAATNLEKDQKVGLVAMADCGYEVNDETDTSDVELHYVDSFRDLAIQFVDEGLYGQIPDALQYYINYDAIGRDLEMDYGQISIGSENIIYRCP